MDEESLVGSMGHYARHRGIGSKVKETSKIEFCSIDDEQVRHILFFFPFLYYAVPCMLGFGKASHPSTAVAPTWSAGVGRPPSPNPRIRGRGGGVVRA